MSRALASRPGAAAVVCAGLCTLAVSGAARAESGPAGDDEEPAATLREEVVVTAERVERAREDVHEHITVLDRGRLAAAAPARLDDVLRAVAGFSLFRRSSSRVAHPTTQGASLRGLGPSGASRALVLVDGVPLNDPFGGWVHWGRVPRSAIDRIEVVRGGGSDVWGSGALGGVVHLRTDPASAPRLAGEARVGSLDEVDASLSASGSSSDLAGAVDAALLDTGGYHVLRRDQRGAIDVPATSRVAALHARGELAAGDTTRLAVSANLFDERRGNGTRLSRNETSAGLVALTSRTAGETGDWAVTAWGQRASFASLFTAQAADRSSERPALDQFDVPSRALGVGVLWSGGRRGRHHPSAGLDARRVVAETNEDFFFVGTAADGRFTRRRRAGGEERLAGLFARDAVDVGSRWRLSFGARADLWSASDGARRETDLATGAVLRDEAYPDRDRWSVSPRVGGRVRVGEAAALTGAVWRSFRAPTVNELYRPFRVRSDITEANPALVSESVTGAELGVRLDGPRWRLAASAFWNEISDVVANVTVGPGPGVVPPCGFVPDGGVCRQRQNVDRARLTGVEAEARVALGRGWTASASYLLADATFRRVAGRPQLEGRALPQVPRHRLFVELVREDATVLGGSLRVGFVDEQPEDDLGALVLGDAVVVDAALHRRVGRGLTLFVAAENLLDRAVEVGRTADGLVSVGAPRSVNAGLRWRGGGSGGPATGQTSSPM